MTRAINFFYNVLMLHDPTQLLAELVKRPSINPMGRSDLSPELLYEHRVTDFLEQQLRSLNVRVERHSVQPGRDNLLAWYTPPGATNTLLLEAHQDTVPVDGMTIDPFAARIAEGKLWGRGACDVKGGGVAMLCAFARLVQTQAKSCNIILAFTVDEEHTFLGIQQLLKLGLKIDRAIIAEPTRLNIVSAHKGVVRWLMETTGVACHSSRPHDGVNAIYRMMAVIERLQHYGTELSHRIDPLLGAATLSVGMIHGGVSPNTVPDRCSIEVDRRLLPGETPASAEAELRQKLSGLEVSITTRLGCPALSPTDSAELIHDLGQAIDRVTGQHQVLAVPYGTDASSVSQAGIPAVVFGPGDIAQAHTKDEWIELREIPLAIEILCRFATATP